MERCDPLALLKQRGLRATPQRVALLSWILLSPGPFTAGDLEAACPSLGADAATVYRLLHRLADVGLIREIPCPGGEGTFGTGRAFEKACPHNPPHSHFSCRRCGSLFCVTDPPPAEDPAVRSLKRRGFVVEGALTTLTGLCPRCAASGGDAVEPIPEAPVSERRNHP